MCVVFTVIILYFGFEIFFSKNRSGIECFFIMLLHTLLQLLLYLSNNSICLVSKNMYLASMKLLAYTFVWWSWMHNGLTFLSYLMPMKNLPSVFFGHIQTHQIYCMLLSCHVRVWEWIYTLYLPECQGTPSSKQARYLKFKWLQRDSKLQPLSS